MNKGDLTIKVGGQELSGWTDLRVTRGVERVVSDFDVGMTEHYLGAEIVEVKRGMPCEVLLGDDKVITGYVDRYLTEFNPRQHTIRVSGRSKTQDIVDCSAVWPGAQIMNGTVAQIADTLCDLGFGIKVKVQAGVDLGPPIPQTNLNVGDTPFDVIESMARFRGLLMYDDPDGNLVLANSGTAKAASGFVEGQNVESAGAAFTMDQRYSHYSAYRVKFNSFQDGGDEANLISEVLDLGVPRYRPKFIVAETNDGGLDLAHRRAVWEMVRRYGRSTVVHVLCDSWRDSAGALWTPNTLVDFNLPSLKLSPQTWLIAEVTYQRNQQGTHAALVLMDPVSFLPAPINYQPFPNDVAEEIKAARKRMAEQLHK